LVYPHSKNGKSTQIMINAYRVLLAERTLYLPRMKSGLLRGFLKMALLANRAFYGVFDSPDLPFPCNGDLRKRGVWMRSWYNRGEDLKEKIMKH
jgi:hypothetical protein